MLKIGLTGGIASGKSEAARLFAGLGAPVVDTDELAREVVEPGTPGLARIEGELGARFLTPDGRLDRARLRRESFEHPELREALERIVHPLVRERLEARLHALRAPYVVVVVPLLVESGLAGLVDRILVVDCPEGLQIERLMRRDGESEDGARRILAAQADRPRRLAVADDIIENDAGPDRLAAAVRRLHEHYSALAAGGGGEGGPGRR